MSTRNGVNKRAIPAGITAIMMFFTVFAVIPMTDLGKVYAAGETGKVTATLLNVRSGAGTGYSRIGTMIKGKTFTVTGTAKDSSGVTWYKLNYNAKTGYVSSQHVNIIQSAVTSVSNLKGTVNTAKDPLIVRSGPGKSYSKLGSMAKGKTFDINGKTTDSSGTVWYRFTFSGKTAYVSSAYVKTTSTASAVTTVSNTTGTVATKSDPLIIRSGPGTNYSRLGTLAKGKTFNVTGQTKDSSGLVWYQLSFNGKTGYASSKYVTVKTVSTPAPEPEQTTPNTPEQTTPSTPEQDKPESTPQYVIKKTGKVNTKSDPLLVRSGPGKSYSKIGSMAKGTTFVISDEAKDSSGTVWYKFNYSGKTGYVSSAYVIKTEEKIEVDNSTNNGTGSNEPAAPAPEPVTFQIGTANADHGLNVRTGAGTGYKLLGCLPKGTTVTVTGSAKASNGKVWYTYQYSSNQVGYLCSDYLIVKSVTSDSDFEAYLNSQGFPESYKTGLRALHAAHPQWVFKAMKVGYSWSDAINKETANPGTNVVSSSSPVRYRNAATYNSNTKAWTTYDGGWYSAAKPVVEHYMDPRNFLDENGIYQFMTHSYDGTTQSADTVAAVIKGSFMQNKNPGGGYSSYASLINDAGKNSGVNPNVLAAMIIQEQGWNGGSGLITGTYSGYKGYYNFFNIGAYHGDGMTAIQRGLWYAKGCDKGETSYSRPWNTPYKAILGGAQFYAEGYVNKNKDSYYSKKFNVYNGLSSVGTYQYMTNVSAATSEGSILKKAYSGNSDHPMTFEIPVFNNMPTNPCPLP